MSSVLDAVKELVSSSKFEYKLPPKSSKSGEQYFSVDVQKGSLRFHFLASKSGKIFKVFNVRYQWLLRTPLSLAIKQLKYTGHNTSSRLVTKSS